MTRSAAGLLFLVPFLLISPLGAAEPEQAPEESADMQRLFDGESLEGWDGDPRLWMVKDGVIHGQTTPEKKANGNTFLICQAGTFGDFELRLSFRCSATNNSGIQYRSQHITEGKVRNPWVVRGYQHEVRNEHDLPNVAGFIYDEGGRRGRLCLVGEKAVWTPAGKKTIADDLIDEMLTTAEQMTEESGKVGNFSGEEKNRIYRSIGLGALKYFILKVDPKKNMTFDPNESVDFNGNTGPFIQYSYARINSLLSKAGERSISIPREIHVHTALNDKEIQLIKLIHQFPSIITEAANEMNPSVVANFLYELAREFNQFYHDHSVLNADSKKIVQLRIMLSVQVSRVIREAMWLLGIDLPERM